MPAAMHASYKQSKALPTTLERRCESPPGDRPKLDPVDPSAIAAANALFTAMHDEVDCHNDLQAAVTKMEEVAKDVKAAAEQAKARAEARAEVVASAVRAAREEMKRSVDDMKALAEAAVTAAQAAEERANRAGNMIWLRAACDAIEDILCCVAAGISQDEYREENCRGFASINNARKQRSEKFERAAFEAVTRVKQSTTNVVAADAVESAVVMALQEVVGMISCSSAAVKDVAKAAAVGAVTTSGTPVAAAKAAAATKLQALVDDGSVKPHDKLAALWTKSTMSAAETLFDTHVPTNARNARNRCKELGNSVYHPQFSSIDAQDLEGMVVCLPVVLKLGEAIEMKAMVASFRVCYGLYAASMRSYAASATADMPSA